MAHGGYICILIYKSSGNSKSVTGEWLAATSGPDLQNILRLLYNSAIIMIDFLR